VRAAAPACYITSFSALAHTIGPQDAEQNVLGQVAFGFDHAAYLAARAPVPVLVCAPRGDFFAIDGTRESVLTARRAFEVLDRIEAIELAEVEGGHDWHPELVRATVRFLVRWLDDRAGHGD